jgi:thymidine kinase
MDIFFATFLFQAVCSVAIVCYFIAFVREQENEYNKLKKLLVSKEADLSKGRTPFLHTLEPPRFFHHTENGSCTVYTGPMFSGKTSMLIANLTRYADVKGLKNRAVIINHSLDTRDVEQSVSTHSSCHKVGSQIQAVRVGRLLEYDTSNFDIIGVDEAQFFEDLVPAVVRWISERKQVFVSGLDSDYLMRPFGNIRELLHVSDSFTKLTALCGICAQGGIATPAPFTSRLSRDGPLVAIGGSDLYLPTCRFHH